MFTGVSQYRTEGHNSVFWCSAYTLHTSPTPVSCLCVLLSCALMLLPSVSPMSFLVVLLGPILVVFCGPYFIALLPIVFGHVVFVHKSTRAGAFAVLFCWALMCWAGPAMCFKGVVCKTKLYGSPKTFKRYFAWGSPCCFWCSALFNTQTLCWASARLLNKRELATFKLLRWANFAPLILCRAPAQISPARP